MTDLSKDLKALGNQGTQYHYNDPSIDLLETFPNPMGVNGAGDYLTRRIIKIKCPEFTSLCPKTGQPDFATIKIKYIPNEKCIESKSLKIYLGAFRMLGEFHEQCVTRIAQDLIKVLDPTYLKVVGQFTPRGGIPFWPQYEYYRNDDEPDEPIAHG